MISGSRFRILLLRTWLRNIGNGFIDHGARALVARAFPEAEIIESSGYGSFVSNQLAKHAQFKANDISQDLGSNRAKLKVQRLGSQIRNVSDFIHPDLAVLPGCILGQQGLGNYAPILRTLSTHQTPLILVGAGGSSYDSSTLTWVKKALEPLNVIGLISRDPVAYDAYKNLQCAVRSGIDCAFFLNDAYMPPKSDTEFVAATFDKTAEPALTTDLPIIRPNHEPYGYARPFHGFAGTIWEWFRRNRSRYKKSNVFISDLVEDYLFIYANARTTYSDRIHACVPSMVYGQEAQFFFKTPRAGLFTPFFGDRPWDKPRSLNPDLLSAKKSEMIKCLREIVLTEVNLELN